MTTNITCCCVCDANAPIRMLCGLPGCRICWRYKHEFVLKLLQLFVLLYTWYFLILISIFTNILYIVYCCHVKYLVHQCWTMFLKFCVDHIADCYICLEFNFHMIDPLCKIIMCHWCQGTFFLKKNQIRHNFTIFLMLLFSKWKAPHCWNTHLDMTLIHLFFVYKYCPC